VEGLERLRLSSLEPADVDDALLSVLRSHGCCVPHVHLPLQSGSARILRRMNRQYSRDDFVRLIDRVRGALDRPAITTDMIVGIPGETEADFASSMEIARYAEFCKIHVFPFSAREGTAAARWETAFVEPRLVRERAQRLAELEAELSLRFRTRFVGETERVIVERHPMADPSERQRPSLRSGRADRYFEVRFEDAGAEPGDLVHVRIDRVTPARTHGTRLDHGCTAR
jgi:threonylcarbamoyladenosine tRNA methylthiotransferase MtaB